MRILIEDTMALAVDYQERLMPAIFEAEQVISNSVILWKGLQELGIPILVTEQYPKGLGPTVEPVILACAGAKVREKNSFSCFDEETIAREIRDSGRKNIVLAGCEAHVCVLQTAIDLIGGGYNLVLVSDCVGSRKAKDKEYALHRAQKEGAFLSTYEAVLFELLRYAGTETFKAISKLVKG